MKLRDRAQELWELGLFGAAFRAQWEFSTRFVLPVTAELESPPASLPEQAALDFSRRLPFADPFSVADALRDRIPEPDRARLRTLADEATRGRILGFGRHVLDYGDPVDWFLNPMTGERWSRDTYWSVALREGARVGDVKLSWEVARFPHFYAFARAAAFFPEEGPRYAEAAERQLGRFLGENPPFRGIHWFSGQEIAVRLMAWVFTFDALLTRRGNGRRVEGPLAQALYVGALQIERVIAYAEHAVYNNHLLAEALALYLVGVLLQGAPEARRWRERGRSLLDEQAEAQFYRDGAYLQLSSNYHRTALQLMLWATLVARSAGDRPCPSWLRAIDRSITFLVAHQNEADGRLPNSGANDGSLPSPLSTVDFPDFRPTLQAASVIVRGERLYEPGPWDEEAAWLEGVHALDLPLRPPRRTTVSFPSTGFHVLRGTTSFATFRCGSVQDRFGQIDMMHVGFWWRGMNVFVDPGTYLYNGPPEWHAHFTRTAAHNTLTIDGRDQMAHVRQFKFIYPVKAKLVDEVLSPSGGSFTGEHDGYKRYEGGCVHRRSVALVGDDLLVVLDEVRGAGDHDVRLHWLAGDFPHDVDAQQRLCLATPEGAIALAVFDEDAQPLEVDVARGAEDPPRGWLSRYYAEKVPVASLAVERRSALPLRWLSVIGPGEVTLERRGDVYEAASSTTRLRFRNVDGSIRLEETKPG